MPEGMAASKVFSGGKNKGRAYVDRDKPAQIRFSNISAAKGKFRCVAILTCGFTTNTSYIHRYITSADLAGFAAHLSETALNKFLILWLNIHN